VEGELNENMLLFEIAKRERPGSKDYIRTLKFLHKKMELEKRLLELIE